MRRVAPTSDMWARGRPTMCSSTAKSTPAHRQVLSSGLRVGVNGGTAQQVFFDNTVNYTTYQELAVDVQLNGGNNTIKFYNSATSPNPNIESGWAPVLAQIKIASAQ